MPAGTKRDRDGDNAANPLLQAFKAKHRAAWPEPETLAKHTAAIKAEAEEANDAAAPSPRALRAFAEYMYRNHDQPHNARLEWWYINGHVGTNPATGNSYSFFAAFFRLHIAGDHFAYAVNWALTEAPALETTSESGEKTRSAPTPAPYVPAAGVANVGNYYTFALQDPITPIAIDTLMSKGRFKMADPRIAQQLQTIARAGLLPSPDNIFTTPSVCRGSSDDDETLYVEVEGNVFSAHFPKGAAAPTYTMKLTGTTARGDVGIPETTATLDVTFSPNVEGGFGPVLQGKNGVVGVENFEDDMFYYFSPKCSIPADSPTRLTINGETIPLTPNGHEEHRIWLDHEFGGAPAVTEEERSMLEARGADKDYEWDWAALHVPGLASIGMAIVREEDPSIPPMIWAAIQPDYAANGREGTVAPAFSVYFDPTKASDDPTQPIRIDVDTSVPTFASPDTGLVFPTAFNIHIPSLKNLKLRTVVAIPQQEFINLMAKPSYLEGRSNIEASWVEGEGKEPRHVVTGMGFQEARGKLNTIQIEQIAMITHATIFMPAEMQPAPPAEAAPLMPAAALPQTLATVSAMMAFAPPPKPKPNHVALIAATVATYVSLLHFGGSDADDEANAKRFIRFWVDEKNKFLTATTLGERAGVKEIGLAALMQKELEGMLLRKVPSVVAAAASASTKEKKEAIAMQYIFDVENSNSSGSNTNTAIPTTTAPTTAAVSAEADAAPSAVSSRGVIGHYESVLPTEAQLETPSTVADREAFAAAADGRWAFCAPLNIDSTSEFLGAQGVNIAVRLFANALKPTIVSKMDHGDGGKVETTVELMVGNQSFTSLLNGRSYSFDAAGRGTLESRACLLRGGEGKDRVVLAQRNRIPCGPKGVEFKIFATTTPAELAARGLRTGQRLPEGLAADHPIMRETSIYFTAAQEEKAAAAGGVFDCQPTAMMSIFYAKEV